MNALRMHVALIAVLGLAASLSARAWERVFEPVPQSPAQIVQTVKDSRIISTAGARMDVGAAVAPTSARTAWLSVSVKNKSGQPARFGDDVVHVSGDGRELGLRSAEDALKGPEDDGYVRDRCANASDDSMINCNIDWFNQRQHKRAEQAADADRAAREQELAPGRVLARRFEIELPRKAAAGPATFRVSVTMGGETIAFDFRETAAANEGAGR